MIAGVLWFALAVNSLRALSLLLQPVAGSTAIEGAAMWRVLLRVLYLVCIVLALMQHAERCT